MSIKYIFVIIIAIHLSTINLILAQPTRINNSSGLTQQSAQPTIDPSNEAELIWLLTGKGNPSEFKQKSTQSVRSGVYRSEFSGTAETPKNYFKGWYTPYETWPSEMQLKAFQHSEVINKDFEQTRTISATSRWTQSGPFGMRVLESSPTVYFSGRVSALDFNSKTGLHVGAASGGLWGKPVLFFLQPLSDQLPSLSIGGIAVHPINPDTIFVGTGEYNIRSGTGIYRTVNGGSIWSKIFLKPGPINTSKILIPPWNSSVVFVSGNAGIYKSTNTGDTWSRVLDDDISDITTSQGGSQMLAGSFYGLVYRSTDQGDTWDQLTSGLPTSNGLRVSLYIAPNNSNRAYVQIVNRTTNQVLGVYRTSDLYNNAPSWYDITPSGVLNGYMWGQGWYNNVLTVHPENYNLVWLGGGTLLKSNNGGNDWEEVGVNSGQVHADIHELYYRTSDNLFYVGCDGGIFTTDDDGATWNSLINTVLPITQFYNIDVSNNDHRVKYGASQDNGIAGTSTSSPLVWIFSEGGDGLDVVVDSYNPQNIYATNGIYGPPAWRRKKTTNSGLDWFEINNGIGWNVTSWSIFLDENLLIPEYLFTNSGRFVYTTMNGGNNWNNILSVYTGGPFKFLCANSTGTFIYATNEYLPERLLAFSLLYGEEWEQMNISEGLPNKIVKRVVTSLTYSGTAYALMAGIGDHEKIFRTTNRGQVWENITGDLPDVPVNDLVENPNNSQVLWLGTDQGAYKSTDGGTNWLRWNLGMPVGTIITDVEYVFYSGGDYILAGTYGRSTFERAISGEDPVFVLSIPVVNFGMISQYKPLTESLYVRNAGNGTLKIDSARVLSEYFSIEPSSGAILPGDSITFYITAYPSQKPGLMAADIEFNHDADGSPTYAGVVAFVGDSTQFRTFVPESLMVKKEVKRKTTSTLWCFDFSNSWIHRDPARSLYVKFKNQVQEFAIYEPFLQIENVDGKGKTWLFSDGSVEYGTTVHLCGTTKKSKPQEVVQWWFGHDTGSISGMQGQKMPTTQYPGMGMPNTANFRMEIFEQHPFNKDNPLIIGVADKDAKNKKVAYAAFAKHGDVYGSLTPGRSGKQHTGPARYFDYFDNHKEIIGVIKKLTPDKQSNELFAELIALKLNIIGSALSSEITPAGFGELKYSEFGNPLDGKMIKEIAALADTFMTYGDSSKIGSAEELYNVLRMINVAFVGPIDTISFSKTLRFTGVKPIAEVPYLMRDPSIQPAKITPIVRTSTMSDMFELYQNYPNPFNPRTVIEFNLPVPSIVTLKVYNVLGQEIRRVTGNEEMDEGLKEVEFDATALPSGIYFYQLIAQEMSDEFDDETMIEDKSSGRIFINVRKMVIIK